MKAAEVLSVVQFMDGEEARFEVIQYDRLSGSDQLRQKDHPIPRPRPIDTGGWVGPVALAAGWNDPMEV